MSLLKSILRIIFGVIIAIPLLLYPFLYLMQDKLIFIQPKVDKDFISSLKKTYPYVEEVKLKTSDNVTLHGWYVKNSFATHSPLIIYFGGNAEEVSGHVVETEQFKGWSLLLVNYRGYGLSEGSPSEKNLYNDAILLYDIFSKRTDVDSSKIMAFGRSLGTGVAVYLASQRSLKGAILVSPYDSVRSIAQEIYPYVPIAFLLKHHFDAIKYAPNVKIDMLALVAEFDRTITPEHSFNLINAWGGTIQQQIIPNTNHNNITLGLGYWENITIFLNSMLD